MFNRVLALGLLILLSPVWLVLALAIKLESFGPSLFKQKRVGQFGKHFTIYKFRTMIADMPDLPADQVADNDTRFTRLGRFLRRFSLDEIPQLWNIVRGDMNFIGPRPALYNQDKLIALREEAGVNRLKPGITGWAQVNGRDNISVVEKVSLDKFYLDNRSWRLNLRVLWLTLLKSINGDDLYANSSGGRMDTNSSGHRTLDG